MLFNQLSYFITNKTLRNVWLHSEVFHVYVRKSYRFFDDNKDFLLPCDYDIRLNHSSGPNCLDIASVEVDEAHIGKGHFKNFIIYAEQINPYPYIMVESVQNETLRTNLLKNGYSIDINSACMNFFKIND